VENLPIKWQVDNAGVPAIYNGGLPAELEIKDIKTPWFNKVKSIKWSDFFQLEHNKIITYRIIPHARVTNNNRRLWKAIYKMFEMYERPKSRLERDGFKFTYREKDYFWYDVVFRQEKGERKIEFYVSTSEYQAQKLKRKLENKMAVTIQEDKLESLQIPKENTIIQEMKYLKHDMFSMNTSQSETKTPIASILNTIDELQHDGDFARLSICNEAENRQKWMKNAQWATEKLQKGKVPQRANVSSKKIMAGVKTGVTGVINEINDLVTDTFQAFSNVFFKSDKDYKKEKVIEKGHGLEDEISATKRSNASLEKINAPVFKSRIRVAAHSQDKLTRETMSETLSLSMGELSENNELHGIKIRVGSKKYKEVHRELNHMSLSKRSKVDGDINLISTEEMNKLALQMPNKELQMRYDDALSVKNRVEVDIPSVLINKNNLKLGYAENKDQEHLVGLPAHQKDEFYCGYTFIGKQGAGKDNSIQNFVCEGNMNHGISFVIPDWICQEGHKGMADGIRDLLPPEKIIDLDLSNEDYIIPMDLTEVIQKLGRKGASRFGDEIMDFINMEDLPRSKRYLRTAAKASGGSLYNIKRIIEDEEFRIERIEELQNEGNMRLANDLIQWGDNDELGNKTDAIINRLDDFFGNETLFDIFAQPPLPEVNFEKWMKEGKVIIVRMPKRKLGRGSNTLAHWVTLKVLMTRFLMSDEDKEKHGCFMVFNEPEQVQSKGMSELMGRIATEGRKERLGSIFAFHHWDKLPHHLQDNLIAGGINQFLFANDHTKTFEMAKSRLEPTFTVDDALQTPKHYAIAILNTKEPLHAFMIHMLPPIPLNKRHDNSFITKRHAQMYGRKWSDLQNIV